MTRTIVFACAALVGFGLTLERPSNLAEARRRCCCRHQYSGNSCQTGYTTYAYQNQYGYQNQPVNQCAQYGTQYQSYSQGGETNVAPAAPAPAPAPDNHSTYYRGGNYRDGTNPPAANRNGTTVPPPAPGNSATAPAPNAQQNIDTNRATNGAAKVNPPDSRPASPPPVPE